MHHRESVQEASLGERNEIPRGDYKVIEDANVEQRQCLNELAGDLPVRFAGFGDSRRVVVPTDDARSVRENRCLEHFSGVNHGAVDSDCSPYAIVNPHQPLADAC